MKRPLLAFFALTYVITWSCWTAALAISSAPLLAGALFLFGTFAPAIVAIALTDRIAGRSATETLAGRVFRWRVGASWYLFAIAYIPVIKLTAAIVYRVTTGAWPRFGVEPWYLMALVIPFSTMVQAGEEIGWRGYALPGLSKRFGLPAAGVILGVIWASWHLPLFFARQSDTYGQSFPLYLLQVTALSVAAAYLYWRTQGSLLLVMLMHAAVNNIKDIVPSAVPGATNPFAFSASPIAWTTVGLLWLVAAYLLIQMRGVRSID